MLFKKLINYIYDSEINCRIEWMWDGGFTWCLLDGSYPRILKDDDTQGNSEIIKESPKSMLERSNPFLEKDWIARGCKEDIGDALCDLFEAIINHFPTSSAAIKLKDFDENREHFIICEKCGDLLDCRDLEDVFSHEHDDKFPVIDKNKNYLAHKKGDSVVWNKGNKINLN
jgi:hypothetical protein